MRRFSDAAALQEAVLDSITRFQEKLTCSQVPAVARLWNYEGMGRSRTNFAPKDEEDLSDELARWLRDDLARKGVILNREVQLRRGKRADVIVDAISAVENCIKQISIVIEVKGCWNRDVKHAIRTQLVDDYLATNGLTHGIYLVGWYSCARPANSGKTSVRSRRAGLKSLAGSNNWRYSGCFSDAFVNPPSETATPTISKV